MSVFRVKLSNTQQGGLDINPATGAQFATSIQRTIYVTGPGKTYRKLADGETFTDCNYWKRFAYPNLPLTQAFIEVVTDDGSVYSDISEENTYPKVYDLSVAGASTYEDNVVDILGDTGGHAVFCQITNQDEQAVKVKVNGLAIFDLPANADQIFNHGDLSVTKLEFDNSTSGATTADIQVLMSIKSPCNS